MSLLKRLGKEEGVQTPVKLPKTLTQTTLKISNKKSAMEIELHNYLVDELKKHKQVKDDQLARLIRELSQEFFEFEGDRLTFEEKNELLKVVESELTGFGPITKLLDDPDINEVMVNSPSEVFVEKNGRLLRTDVSFRDDDHIKRVIDRIVSPLGRRIDESVPMVDARLPDGSRVNAVIPPLALKGPTVTIRKFSTVPFTVEDLIRMGTLSKDMAMFLEACVNAKLNIFISGGTGSGKTSTLNVLSSFIPNSERIVTIEDAAELKLSQDHVVSLESRPPNIEGVGAITIRDLVRNSLRMRPDRIIVGEVRSAETLDMLQAMNTGHDGSLGTGHANTPRDMLSRLETMVLMSGYDLPVKAIREQISSALDLIIHQARMRDGTRKITHITEVLGLEENTIVLQDLFLFKEKELSLDGNVEGEFSSTGIRPHFSDQLEKLGFEISSSWFEREW
ncbi:CpaF family protein [Pseudalkalibacillus berkeleyi]|uniref:CpaF family protein n=1 Tax=Pseudalkalibacillus berkeleyi TaxID=1069813 RepID=A0ABS9H0B7_9BACL|nr:CpaF family protein [Pseudalkalibacillus berkeleyi]MCF6137285.1 CpaF family protein [Pseudalkalibacillus berkeleyi]